MKPGSSPPPDPLSSSKSASVSPSPSCGDEPDRTTTRRRFLQASALLPIVAHPAHGDEPDAPGDRPSDSKWQPESFWKDRIEAPPDGKRYGWFIDSRRCFGCHACEVSCKEENDVPLGSFIRQTFYKDVGDYPNVKRFFLPVTCQHCEDAPCIKACPCGALHKGTGGTVVVDYHLCCGHGRCVDACPYGAIYLDPVARQAVKCHNCYHRLEVGMEPACVATCPAEAIHFGDLNDPNAKVSRKLAEARRQGVSVTTLRPEEKTRPRAFYAGDAVEAIEPDLPRQGQSFSGTTYDIYRWKQTGPRTTVPSEHPSEGAHEPVEPQPEGIHRSEGAN